MIIRESIGIAMDARRLTLACMKATPLGMKLAGHESLDLETAADHRAQGDQISDHIKGFLDRNGIRNASLFLGLPPGQCIVRTIHLPLAAKENLRQAIGYDLKKFIPLPSEDIYYDYQIISEDKAEKRMEILLAAAKRSDLSAFMNPQSVLARNLCGVETTATAWINGLHWTGACADTEPCLAVWIDADICRLIVQAGGQIQQLRNIRLKDHIEDRAAQIAEAADQLAEPFDSDAGPIPLHCLGPGVTEDIIGYLGDSHRWAVRSLKLPAGLPNDPHLVTAAGLALKGIQPVVLDLNLLPVSARKKPSRAGQYVTAGLAAMALLAGLSWMGSAFFYQRAAHAGVDRQIAQLSEEIRTIDRIQSDIALLRQQMDYIRRIQPEPAADTLGILEELSRIIPPSAWLRNMNINGKNAQMDGYADDAAQLIPILDRSPLLTNVIFLSAITKGRDGKERFRIGFDIVSSRDRGGKTD